MGHYASSVRGECKVREIALTSTAASALTSSTINLFDRLWLAKWTYQAWMCHFQWKMIDPNKGKDEIVKLSACTRSCCCLYHSARRIWALTRVRKRSQDRMWYKVCNTIISTSILLWEISINYNQSLRTSYDDIHWLGEWWPWENSKHKSSSLLIPVRGSSLYWGASRGRVGFVAVTFDFPIWVVLRNLAGTRSHTNSERVWTAMIYTPG